MERSRSWSDLRSRIIAALALAVVAGLMLWVGGWLVWVFVMGVAALMLWELAMMLRHAAPSAGRSVLIFTASALLILPAAIGLARLLSSPAWLLGVWLILVVVATDVAGYFGGKALGGPKLAPRLSPKKTWSGTLSGWVAAALVSGLVAALAGFEGALGLWAVAAVIVSVFAQAGDLVESGLKRRLKVKDSSQLIPGHGGFCDRFDGLVGGCYGLVVALAMLPVQLGAA